MSVEADESHGVSIPAVLPDDAKPLARWLPTRSASHRFDGKYD